MERWVIYAVLSMVFAGVTAVIAKQGLAGISSELGLVVRTGFVTVYIILFGAMTVPREQYARLDGYNYAWLGLSGLATAASWVFYYKALKEGEVSTVAIIDKGSFVVAVILSWLLLSERLTPRVVAGCVLIIAGLMIAAKK